MLLILISREYNRTVANTAMHLLRLIALLGRHSSRTSFQRCLRASTTLNEIGLMDLISRNSTPLLIKSATLQIVQYLHDVSTDHLIIAILIDIHYIEPHLVLKAKKKKSFPNLFHTRGENDLQNISSVVQLVEHPSLPPHPSHPSESADALGAGQNSFRMFYSFLNM
jgi:hypothetical protein